MSPGIYIKATNLLQGDYFEEAVIYITEVKENGITGFVINKIFPRNFNELEEFRHSPAFPLHEGGPVDQEHIFVLHRRPGIIPGSTVVAGNIYREGDFKEAVKQINNKTLTGSDIRLFIGYCGWDAGELEAEIAEGSWVITGDFSLF